MPIPIPTVFIVDADGAVRESLRAILHRAGWQPETFASATDLLARPHTGIPSCLLLEASPHGDDSLELQQQLAAERPDISIVVTTGHHNVQLTVRAMKAGAVEVLMKPLTDELVLHAVREAIERSEAVLSREAEAGDLRQRYAHLSGREREVMSLVVSGLLNKQVGGTLGISEVTVKAHRGHMMRKMGAGSLAALVTMAMRLHLPLAPIRTAPPYSDSGLTIPFNIPMAGLAGSLLQGA